MLSEMTQLRGEAWCRPWTAALMGFVEDLASRGYSDFTLRDYRSDVLRLAAEVGGHPDDLDEDKLRRMDRVMRAEGLTLAAVRRRSSAHRRFLSYLREEVDREPLGCQLLRAAACESPVDRLLIGLIYFSGLRLVEIAALEGRDLRLRVQLVVTRKGQRFVPLHPTLAKAIEEAREFLPFAAYRPVLPGAQGFPITARTLHGRFQRVSNRRGFAGLKPDRIRREVSVFLRDGGVPSGLITAFLGRDRGKVITPRRGRLADLSGIRARLFSLPCPD